MRPISPIEAVEPSKAPKRITKRKLKKRKKSSSPTMRFLNGVLAATLLISVILVILHVWFEHKITVSGPLSKDKLINISKGATEHQIASILEREGIVESRYLVLGHQFRDRLWHYMDQHEMISLKAGSYSFKKLSSSKDIVNIIRSGVSEVITVVLPEGLTSYEIVARLRRNKKLSGDILNIPPEGTLRPDTYRVRYQASRNELINLMTRQHSIFLEKTWQKRQPNLPYKNAKEALVLASMVEKEMGPRDNPSIIASVFINRLRRGMRLQSDPTILYGKFGPSVTWGSTIYKSDIRKKTLHNTYQIDGLPPTPICNPGSAAVEAVLNPAETSYLYFVADGKGGHVFSETLAEHNRAVVGWRRIERRIRSAKKSKSGRIYLPSRHPNR
ncbi:MAG: Endolytic murein transglycosylase [Hyphomicrobiaceae bacterium hypho_1]